LAPSSRSRYNHLLSRTATAQHRRSPRRARFARGARFTRTVRLALHPPGTAPPRNRTPHRALTPSIAGSNLRFSAVESRLVDEHRLARTHRLTLPDGEVLASNFGG